MCPVKKTKSNKKILPDPPESWYPAPGIPASKYWKLWEDGGEWCPDGYMRDKNGEVFAEWYQYINSATRGELYYPSHRPYADPDAVLPKRVIPARLFNGKDAAQMLEDAIQRKNEAVVKWKMYTNLLSKNFPRLVMGYSSDMWINVEGSALDTVKNRPWLVLSLTKHAKDSISVSRKYKECLPDMNVSIKNPREELAHMCIKSWTELSPDELIAATYLVNDTIEPFENYEICKDLVVLVAWRKLKSLEPKDSLYYEKHATVVVGGKWTVGFNTKVVGPQSDPMIHWVLSHEPVEEILSLEV